MTALLIALTVTFNSPYCNGFAQGWKEGWCYDRTACIAMPTPPCPVHAAGKDRWQDGYNDGFVRAKDEADELRGKKKPTPRPRS